MYPPQQKQRRPAADDSGSRGNYLDAPPPKNVVMTMSEGARGGVQQLSQLHRYPQQQQQQQQQQQHVYDESQQQQHYTGYQQQLGGGGANVDVGFALPPGGQHHHRPDHDADVDDDRHHHYDYLRGESGWQSNADDAHSPPCCCGMCRVKRYLRTILNAEHLHRSFCYGAIDGMLTGSSLAAASAGLGLFDPYGPLPHRLVVVSLVLASCTADGLCMGVGHVWSTYVMADAAKIEREEEMLTFRDRRGVSKARLVHMLMQRGMLKIDAMSIADTLEGYPDIFLSALVGDGHLQGPLGLANGSAGDNVRQSSYGSMGGGGGGGVDASPPRREGTIQFGTPGGLSMYEVEENEDDDSTNHGWLALVAESRQEGAMMMLAFCLFAVLPALTHAFVPMWLIGHHPTADDADATATTTKSTVGNQNGDDGDVFVAAASQGTGISSTSLTVSITVIIMLLLGIWKSKFTSSSWIFYGMQTVLLLILCVMSAYFIGLLAALLINGSDDGS